MNASLDTYRTLELGRRTDRVCRVREIKREYDVKKGVIIIIAITKLRATISLLYTRRKKKIKLFHGHEENEFGIIFKLVARSFLDTLKSRKWVYAQVFVRAMLPMPLCMKKKNDLLNSFKSDISQNHQNSFCMYIYVLHGISTQSTCVTIGKNVRAFVLASMANSYTSRMLYWKYNKYKFYCNRIYNLLVEYCIYSSLK